MTPRKSNGTGSASPPRSCSGFGGAVRAGGVSSGCLTLPSLAEMAQRADTLSRGAKRINARTLPQTQPTRSWWHFWRARGGRPITVACPR